MRVRRQDIQGAIFEPVVNISGDKKTEFKNDESDTRVAICYTLSGKHDYLDEDDYPVLGDLSDSELAEDRPESFAKKVSINDGEWRYYVRTSSNGRMLNPLGQEESRHNKMLHHAGRREMEFRQVNNRVFKFYVDFLKTKNPAHLRNAEREAF